MAAETKRARDLGRFAGENVRVKHAWFGTGLMGAAFVERLRESGRDVAVYNRTFAKAKALECFGAVAFEDPRDAARGADVLHLMLTDDAVVDTLLERLTDAISPDAVVIDHSTVAPAPTKARFVRMHELGLAFLHGPVMAAPPAARGGSGLMMVSGSQATFERVREELSLSAADVWYLGERPEKAAAMKLFGNETLMFLVAGLADGYALARSAGIDSNEAFELFEHFKPQGALEFRGKKMSSGDFSPLFELTMGRKDVRLMLETAAAGDVVLHFLPAIAARMDALIASGHGAADLSVLGITEA